MALNRFHHFNGADYNAKDTRGYQDNLDLGQPDPGFAPAGSFSAAAGSNLMDVTSASSGLVFVNTFAAGVRVWTHNLIQ